MKTLWNSVVISFSMFSIFPTPKADWTKENMRYMLAALPLVGIVIGGALYLWSLLCSLLSIGVLLKAVGYCLLPILLSGGIHMDGFCDTVDALSSHAEPARKKEILKDSHAGAFAIIFCGVYLLASVGLYSEVENVLLLVAVPMLSRSTGALASTLFHGSTSQGLLATFREGASAKSSALLVFWSLCSLVWLFFQNPLVSLLCLVVEVVSLLALRHMANKEFGGMSGDLAGDLITLSELAFVACCFLGERIGALL